MNPKPKTARRSAADGLQGALLLGLAWICPYSATGQSDSCGGRIEPDVYYRTAGTFREKNGFFQHCGNYGPPPYNPPEVYLRSTLSGSETYQETNSGVEVNMSGESSQVWTYHTNRWQEGALVTEFTGGASVYVNKYGSVVDCTFTQAGGGIWLEDPLADPANCLTTSDTNCCEAWKANGWEYYHNFMTWTNYCEGGDITHKVDLGTLTSSGRNCYVRWDDILSIEYTTELLIGFTIADVGAIAYGGSWQTYGTAYTILGYDSTYGYPDWKCTSGKMEYQLRFSSLANTRYLVEWDEITLWDEGGVSVARMSEYVQGNGGEVSTATHERLPPTQPGLVFVSNGKVTEVPPASSSSPDNDCQGCGTGRTEFGGAVFEPGQLLIRFNLGQARFGEPAGELVINEGLPSWILANPKALRYFGGRSDVELISSGGALRQVKAPQGLADIVPNPTNAFAYDIRFFFNSGVLSKVNGLYLTTNSPLVSWTVENPDGQSSTNQLQITEHGAGGTRDYLYTWDAGSRTWILFRPENLRIDEVALAWDPSGKIQTETLWIRNAAGQPVEGRVRKHQAFRYDSPYPNLRRYGLKLVEERRPAAGGDEVSTYLYDSSTFQSNGRLPLRWMIQPSGYWEYYEYTDPNDSRRLTRKIAQSLNASTNSVPSGTNSCRVTLFEYNPTVATPGSGDPGTVEPFTPRRTIETLLGQEVARSYVVLLTAERRDIRCQTPLAAWNAADNLVTVTRYYPAGDSFAGKVRSVDHPDGTRQVYFYSTNTTQMTTITLLGAKDAANSTNIVAGTRTTSVIDLLGRPVSRTTVEKVTPSIVLSSETFSLPDDYGRPQRVTYLDGTFAETYYSCCGIDQTIDRDGATTQFTYDALGRQVTSTRYGITITNILDA
ncbi:MAG: hypothetical protein KJ072_28970, partial [Verrucomicrobia bacterium]|nr:hypothetical protein [Verrucomicrobiota bacterium]